jgi:hypothetical protein
MSFAAITLCVASQRVFIFVVYFVIDSVRKRLDTPSYRSCVTYGKICQIKLFILFLSFKTMDLGVCKFEFIT